MNIDYYDLNFSLAFQEKIAKAEILQINESQKSILVR